MAAFFQPTDEPPAQAAVERELARIREQERTGGGAETGDAGGVGSSQHSVTSEHHHANPPRSANAAPSGGERADAGLTGLDGGESDFSGDGEGGIDDGHGTASPVQTRTPAIGRDGRPDWTAVIDGITDVAQLAELRDQLATGRLDVVPEVAKAPPADKTLDQAPVSSPTPAQPAATETPEGGQALLEQLAAEDADHKPGERRFRIKPRSEVDAKALEIHKANPDLTLDDAVSLAKRQLGLTPTQPEAAPVSSSPQQSAAPAPVPSPSNGLPGSLEALEADLTRVEAELEAAQVAQIEALTEDFDKTAAVEAQKKINALAKQQIHLREQFTLKQIEAERQAIEAEQRAEASFQQAARQAEELYPQASQPNSPLFKRILEYNEALKESGDDRYYDPRRPLLLAQWAANDLGIAPRLSAPSVTPTTAAAGGVSIPRLAPSSAAPAARTLPAPTMAAQLDQVIDAAESIDDLRAQFGF